MKFYFLIIILTFIDSIINSTFEFDLTSGSPMNFSSLDFSNTYKFYISDEFGQNMKIEITQSDSFSETEILYIYEYESRNSTKELKYHPAIIQINDKKFEMSYAVYFESCTYIAFKIEIIDKLTSVSVKATVKSFIDYEFDLNSGSSTYFLSLSTLYTYKFYIPATPGLKVDIEFNKGDSYSTNKNQNIKIYEYSSRYSKSFLDETSISMTYDSVKNSY